MVSVFLATDMPLTNGVSSAMENYSYVQKDDIRFEYSNPEALYTYSEEELRILIDEMAD